jgi:hypothetical protein
MVSLVAGLLIVLAVMGLARTATNTFHEQIRTTASEMSLRIASQRLAGDLSRASFYGTGNIRFDPRIARLAILGDPLLNTGSRYLSLNNMAGVRIYMAGSPEAGNFPLETDNILRPQAIDLTGNMTTNDQYLGVLGPAQLGCGAQSMTLNNDDPAVMRMLLAADQVTPLPAAQATTILQQAFLPVAGAQFAARVLDNSGKTHFVVVCNASVVAGRGIVEFLPAATGTPILTPAETGGKGGEDGPTPIQISPVQTVRWNLRRLPNPALDPPQDAAAKFDLVRQFIDASTGLLVGPPEVVAEYVIDLRFALTVDRSPIVPPTLSFDFEDEPATTLWSATGGVSVPVASTPGPHRIRSIQFRVAGRAALPDRDSDMPRDAPGYVYRYCISGGPLAGCTRFARARTITSEVAMLNQARLTY